MLILDFQKIPSLKRCVKKKKLFKSIVAVLQVHSETMM